MDCANCNYDWHSISASMQLTTIGLRAPNVMRLLTARTVLRALVDQVSGHSLNVVRYCLHVYLQVLTALQRGRPTSTQRVSIRKIFFG
jgi:hypothetical protein